MIVLDVNVVLPLYLRQAPTHDVAQQWLDEVTAGGELVAVPNPVWHSVLRLATNPAIVSVPSSLREVFAFVAAFRDQPACRTAEPGARHLAILEHVCAAGQVRSALVPDAVIAAIAIEHGASVASFDRDFARFPDLRWIVPGE